MLLSTVAAAVAFIHSAVVDFSPLLSTSQFANLSFFFFCCSYLCLFTSSYRCASILQSLSQTYYVIRYYYYSDYFTSCLLSLLLHFEVLFRAFFFLLPQRMCFASYLCVWLFFFSPRLLFLIFLLAPFYHCFLLFFFFFAAKPINYQNNNIKNKYNNRDYWNLRISCIMVYFKIEVCFCEAASCLSVIQLLVVFMRVNSALCFSCHFFLCVL